MAQPKIIFFDIDGTLIDMNKKQIRPKMTETLKRLKQNNIQICIATGRSVITLPHFPDITFDAYITFNGAYCFDQAQTIYSCPLPKEDVKNILQNAAAIQRPVSIATKHRVAANGKDKDLAMYYSFANLEIEITDDFDQVAKEEVYQIMLGCRKSDHAQLLQNTHHAKITSWWDRAVDIIPSQTGKGNGIRQVLHYFHLDPSQAMAFGDGNNDIEMFQAVGISIAMGNASQELKNIASDCCGNVADDGIYHYCKQHHLI